MEKKNSIKSKVMGTVFLVSFLAAIIAIIYFATTNPPVAVFIFGGIFFVIGIIAITSLKRMSLEDAFLILFPLVGLGCMGVSATYIWDFEALKNIEVDKEMVIVLLVLLLFFVVGAGLFFGNILLKNKREHTHTYAIQAQCVDLKISTGSHGSVYAPVFQYYYNGEEYIYTNRTYTNLRIAEVGKYYTLMLNPDEPADAWFPSKKVFWGMVLLGICFMVAAVVAAYMMLFG